MARWLLAVLAALASFACKDALRDAAGAGTSSFGAKLGETCSNSAPCQEGLYCLWQDGVCTRECSSDDDCGSSLICQHWSEGIDQCARPCSDDRSLPHGFLCIEGRRTRCEDVPDQDNCVKCGCPDDLLCKADGCQPKAEVGARCQQDEDCASANCSPYGRVCRVAVGSACDATNCDRCMTFANWSYCSRSCSSDSNCDGRGVCIGNRESGYNCVISCGWDRNARTCPETCAQLPATATATGMYYCGCKSCTILEEKRKLGVPCDNASQCTGTLCLQRSDLCGTTSLVPCGFRGTCSQRCTSSSECGEGAFCSRGLCFVGCQSDADCQQSKCVVLPTDVGALAVCDARGGIGSGCRDHTDCRSGRCASSTCQGSAAIGEACAADGDCMIGRCCSGLCSGACAQP